VLFLWVWCAEQDRSLASRAEQFGALRTIAASPASALIRFVSTRDFGLSPIDRYELSRLQPDSTRTAADLLRLAEFATDAGRLSNALEHLRAAEDAVPGDLTLFARRVLEVKTLLRLGETQNATTVAREWAQRPGTTADELSQMSRPFEQTRLTQMADELLRQALTRDNLPASQRVDLLRRLSEVQPTSRVAGTSCSRRSAPLQPIQACAGRSSIRC
jgi:hypothetical protein